MTRVEERALLRQYLEVCERLTDGIARAAEGAAPLLPIAPAAFDTLSLADENTILAFLKRFEQFEDALHRTLKTISQLMELGKVERLTARDVANRAEKFGVILSAEIWADAVRTRNALAQEYPLDRDKRARQVNDAWEARDVLDSTWQAIQAFVEREGLLDDGQ